MQTPLESQLPDETPREIAKQVANIDTSDAAVQRQSEGRYRTLFEYAPDGIVIADRESFYIDANAGMCRMLGYTRSEFIGLHATDIVIPAEVPHIGPALN